MGLFMGYNGQWIEIEHGWLGNALLYHGHLLRWQNNKINR
jgi:hypothetical protein